MNQPFPRLTAFLAVTAALVLGAAAASAAPGRGDHGHDHGHSHDAPDVKVPATYAEAVVVIGTHVDAIDLLIADGKIEGVQQEAAIVKKIADGLSKLVAKKDSGVPVEARLEVLTAAKALSATFSSFHEAEHSGSLTDTKKAAADLRQHVAVLQKYAPPAPTYWCPMHPEVVSAQQGTCSKCGGMTLVPKAPVK